MDVERVKVVVAAEPLVLRSLLHDGLGHDDRFESYIWRPDDDLAILTETVGADVVLVSDTRPSSLGNRTVVTMAGDLTITTSSGGAVAKEAYSGIADLFDLLAGLVRRPIPMEQRAGPPARRGPPVAQSGGVVAEGGT